MGKLSRNTHLVLQTWYVDMYFTKCQEDQLMKCLTPKSYAGERCPNLALGKPIVQSSTLNGPSLAVDGDNSKDVNSCAQTDSQIRPYIEVDLKGSYDIAIITIQNVDDACCYARMRELQVLSSEDQLVWNICASYVPIVGQGELLT
ncbi:hypothetical protein ScPMuIL_000520 [Solemya velum]